MKYIIAFLKVLWDIIVQVDATRYEVVPPITPPEAPQSPVEPVTTIEPIVVPKYLWDTPANAKHSVRVICDEMGLSVSDKNDLCATIGAESGWLTHPRPNQNKDPKTGKIWSTDFGICQWNDVHHGKEITPDEAENDPEKAVRLMCAYWRRGQRSLWCAYSNGSYKKFL
jgi:hypothetical protein